MGSNRSKKIRGFDRLNDVLKSESFSRDLEEIRDRYLPLIYDEDDNVNVQLSIKNENIEEEINIDDYAAALYVLIEKYKLSQSHYPILEKIFHGEEIKVAIKTPLSPIALIINHDNRTIHPSDDPKVAYELAQASGAFERGIAIQPSSDVSEEELINFIDNNFLKLIKPSLTKSKKISGQHYTQRNEMIKQRKANGESATSLARSYNISLPRIYQILEKD